MTNVEAGPSFPPPYQPPLRGETLRRYQQSLSGVQRWIGDNGEPTSQQPENSWQHTQGILAMIAQEMPRFENLTRAIDLNAVRDMIWLHDGPEIIAGDHYMGSENFTTNRNRQKSKERAGARILLREVPDEQERERLKSIFQRYDTCEPDDLEANFAHLIDKFQGTRFGLEHGGIPSATDDGLDELALTRRQRNAALSLDKIALFAEPLMERLEGEALAELQEFTAEEIARFRHHGFADEVETALERLQLENLAAA